MKSRTEVVGERWWDVYVLVGMIESFRGLFDLGCRWKTSTIMMGGASYRHERVVSKREDMAIIACV